MADLQPVKGTHDLLPDAMRLQRQIEETARQTAELYGYEHMATPIFEFTEVFRRTLGDTSDIVTKEMYTFETKGGDQVTLRPENTASVARAFISEGLAQHAPLKYFYSGPMFRHERPQKGRLRQFHQFGIELIGVAEPQGDVEIIACGAATLKALDLEGQITLELNTLGDPDSRAAYRAVLVEYFSDHADALSDDSRDRLGRNPLRILDSKDQRDRRLVADAPVFSDYLNEQSQAFFDAVCGGLKALGVPYRINTRMVRGLDYYCHTAFEFTTDALGAQGTVMAGGRYDGLIAQMGGTPTPGVGWAAGIERLAMLTRNKAARPRPVALVPIGAAAEARALGLAETLRAAGLRVEMGYGGNIKKRMKFANKIHARAAVLIGDDELARDTATVKNLDTGNQHEVGLGDLAAVLTRAG